MDHKTMLLHLYAGHRAGEQKTCGTKVRYPTEESATEASEAMNKKPTTRHALEPYPCPFCGQWHVGGVWPLEKMESLLGTLGTKTPSGILKAYLATDPDHPGIYIDLITNDIEHPVALVEFDEDNKGIRTLAWVKSEEDYRTDTIWDSEGSI